MNGFQFERPRRDPTSPAGPTGYLVVAETAGDASAILRDNAVYDAVLVESGRHVLERARAEGVPDGGIKPL